MPSPTFDQAAAIDRATGDACSAGRGCAVVDSFYRHGSADPEGDVFGERRRAGGSDELDVGVPGAVCRGGQRADPGLGIQLVWRGLAEPAVADTTLGVYLAGQVSPLGGTPMVDEIARVDRASGQVEAQRRLPATFDSAIAVSGSLWVTTSSWTGEMLWRLDARTFAVEGHWQVSTWSGSVAFTGGSMAVAGGALWVDGGDRLVRLSLATGRVMASIPLPGVVSSNVASDGAGTVLVVGAANVGGIGLVERRDPVTGALLARTPPVIGATALPQTSELGEHEPDPVRPLPPGAKLGQRPVVGTVRFLGGDETLEVIGIDGAGHHRVLPALLLAAPGPPTSLPRRRIDLIQDVGEGVGAPCRRCECRC